MVGGTEAFGHVKWYSPKMPSVKRFSWRQKRSLWHTPWCHNGCYDDYGHCKQSKHHQWKYSRVLNRVVNYARCIWWHVQFVTLVKLSTGAWTPVPTKMLAINGYNRMGRTQIIGGEDVSGKRNMSQALPWEHIRTFPGTKNTTECTEPRRVILCDIFYSRSRTMI